MSVQNAKLLTTESLAQKQSPEIQKVLGLSFEYLLATIGKSRFVSTKQFSESYAKSFTMSTLLVNPFFVAVSNGHSKSLFSLFGDFYAFSFGPASMSLHTLLQEQAKTPQKDLLKYFKIDLTKTPISIAVNGGGKDSSFTNVQECVRNEAVSFNDEEKVTFENIEILSDEGKQAPIYKAIENGVDIVNLQSRNTFFEGEMDVIRWKASYFPVYQQAFNENRVLKINYEDTLGLSERPFPPEKIKNRLSVV